MPEQLANPVRGLVLVVFAALLLVAPLASAEAPPLVGYAGCSNTWMTWQGFLASKPPATATYWPVYDTGGAAVGQWANLAHPIWGAWDAQVAEKGLPDMIVFQLCENEGDPVTYDEVVTAVGNLRAADPGAALYVMAINGYTPVDLCTVLGADGNTDLAAFADQVAADELATRIPDLGPLTSSMTDPIKHCHPTPIRYVPSGRALLGAQMVVDVSGLV